MSQYQNSKSNIPLIDAMRAYETTERLRFHVPGHNGHNLAKSYSDGVLPDEMFRYDYTELEGLDVLSEPESCLLQSQRQAAETFGTEHSFYLVNGASIGIMAAMLSILSPGAKVLLPRNTHRSVISGLVQTGAEPVWCLPEHLSGAGIWGAVLPDVIETHLQDNPGIRLVIITSPTYEGIGSDIPAILHHCRQYGAKLVVDEAHGSLWPFSDRLPASACHLPCDAVIHSLHKTAGSLTQGAIAHLPKGSTLPPERFQQALNLLQTTSPSYLILTSLEATQAFLGSSEGRQAVDSLLTQTQWLREQFQERCLQFRLFEPPAETIWDPSKLWIQHHEWAATDWAPIIEAEGTGSGQGAIAYESATPTGALYLCGLGLKQSDYQQFLNTFISWDQQTRLDISQKPTIDHLQAQETMDFRLPQIAMSPRDAFFSPGQQVVKEKAIGRISRQTVVHCPPGIPILFPGEVIGERHLPQLPDVLEVCQASF